MTSFSFSVRSICLGLLISLMAYTLWLMRTGRLNAHVTVRWILAEGLAILAVLLWGGLPLIQYTSTLGDRELLVVLAVVFFALLAFFILDCLVRISTHTHQIKQLSQELALLRQQIADVGVCFPIAAMPEPMPAPGAKACVGESLRDLLLFFWMATCLCLFLWDGLPGYPGTLKTFFSATFRH